MLGMGVDVLAGAGSALFLTTTLFRKVDCCLPMCVLIDVATFFSVMCVVNTFFIAKLLAAVALTD
jgi:hypothetical protein